MLATKLATLIQLKVVYMKVSGRDQSYLTDQACYEVWKPYNCYRPLPPDLWRVTWPNGSAAPLMSCTCTIHGFVMAGAAPTGKTKQGYEDEHLGSLSVRVRRCGQADWLVSEQRPPTHEQDLSWCSQPMNMQTHTDVTDKYRYLCNNSVKHNVNNSLGMHSWQMEM